MKKGTTNKGIVAALALAVVGSYAPHAGAGSALSRSITDIQVTGTQFAHIIVDGAAVTGRPACHQVAYGNMFIFAINTDKGKALLSLATAAMLAGKKVSVYADNTCTNNGSATTETLFGLHVKP